MIRDHRNSDIHKHGASIHQLDDGVIVVKQTVKRGEGHAARYVIDEDRERHIDPGQDALLARAVRAALAGELERPKVKRDESQPLKSASGVEHESATQRPRGLPISELPAFLASLPRLTEEEAADFERDLENARAERARWPVEDRWAS